MGENDRGTIECKRKRKGWSGEGGEYGKSDRHFHLEGERVLLCLKKEVPTSPALLFNVKCRTRKRR